MLRNRVVSVFGFENCGGTWGLSGAAENGSRENGPNIRDVRPVRRMRSCSATTIGISNRVIGFRCSVGRATCFYWKFVRRFFDRARCRPCPFLPANRTGNDLYQFAQCRKPNASMLGMSCVSSEQSELKYRSTQGFYCCSASECERYYHDLR